MTGVPQHQMPDELRAVDDALIELTSVPVAAPPWSAVVDRIAVAPQSGRRWKVGWSAIIAGGVVAAAVGIGGAVSEPVRETVFEPVANLLPWVDGDPEPAVSLDRDDPPGEPPSDRPATDQRPTDTGAGDSVPSRTTVVSEPSDDGVDSGTDTPIGPEPGDRPVDGGVGDADQLTPEQIERLRREQAARVAEEERRRRAAREQARRDAATSTMTTLGADRSSDQVTRDGP